MRMFGGSSRYHLGAETRPGENEGYQRSKASKKRHARRGFKTPSRRKAFLQRIADNAPVVEWVWW